VTYVLWIVQVLLALTFLFTGGMKLMMSDAMLTEQIPLPALFIRFIAASEVVGAVGLILPGLLKIKPWLTPLAAALLAVIMVGATVITLMTMDAFMALIPLVIGILSAFVAYGRWYLAPQAERTDERNPALAR
jgi:hypothetical protein